MNKRQDYVTASGICLNYGKQWGDQLSTDILTDGLSVRAISKVYPGTVALDNVSMDIGPGEVVALLGENGAGKSTLANIIAGSTLKSSGEMYLDGLEYQPSSPSDAMSCGIGLIHQELRLLPDLSVAENVLVGKLPKKRGLIDKGRMRAVAQEKLRMLNFEAPLDTPVRELSVAAQQQVEIAKALTLDARLLVLDEPTAALSAGEVSALFATVRELKSQGVSFIYVSHRLEEIEQICDRIVVLRDGQWIASHDSAHVPVETLVHEMVGRNVERLFPQMPESSDRIVLHVEGLTSADDKFRDISFDVHAGEVFGIAGIVGAGRTELLRAIAGAEAPADGVVMVDDERVDHFQPRHAIKAGIVMVPEDRKQQGVIVDASVADNVVLPDLKRFVRGGLIREKDVVDGTERVIDRMQVKGTPRSLVAELSGGNQQKIVIGRWLGLEPKVILMDEPTRGIDVGARSAIYEVIAGLAREGVAVVVVSSDLDEVLGLSERVLVMSRGAQRAILDRALADPETVMALATTH